MKNLMLYGILMLSALFAFSSCDIIGGEKNEPEITIATGEQLGVSSEAGTVTINYELINGVDGGEVELVVPENTDWISNVKIESFTQSGMVSFDVEKNISEEPRSVLLSLNYKYDDKVVSALLNLIQEAVVYDYNMDIAVAECRYYGDQGLGYHIYEMRMGATDYTLVSTGEEYYSLTFLCSNKTETLLPEPGVYEVVGVGAEGDHTIQTDEWSVYLKVNDEGTQYEEVIEILQGEIKVERDGESYTFSGVVTDEENKLHNIYYNGEVDVRNMTIMSTIEDDIDMDLTGYTVDAYYNGRAFNTGNVWMLVIYKSPKTIGDFTFQLQCVTPVEYDMSTGLGLHNFTADVDGTYGYHTFTLGTESIANYNASWIFTWVYYDKDLDQMYVGEPAAPFRSGDILVEPSEGGTYAISINTMDDNNHTIEAYGSGLTINHIDNTTRGAGFGEGFSFATKF